MPVGKVTILFIGEVSVLQVCKLNTNHAIKFLKCSKKKIWPTVYQKMVKAGRMFSCPWLLIH